MSTNFSDNPRTPENKDFGSDVKQKVCNDGNLKIMPVYAMFWCPVVTLKCPFTFVFSAN